MTVESLSFLEAILASAVSAGTIYLIASVGECITERAGVINLGLEGIMAMGAITSFILTLAYGHLAAILGAALVGAVFGLLHAFLSVSLRLNQIVVGLAITWLGLGLSGFMGAPEVARELLKSINPAVPAFLAELKQAPRLPELKIEPLNSLPVLGRVLFSQNILVHAGIITALILWFILTRTRWGLSLRSVGENPALADTAGVNVFAVRYLAVILGSSLAGVAGAYLFIGYQPFWVEDLTRSRGFIAVSLVILSSWSPLRAIAAAYLFGGVETLQFRIPLRGFGAETPQLIMMLPYVITIVTLILISLASRGRLPAPAALGKPYSREE
ncbi:MAG: ABC transporter permease [Nitrososphaerota archaeon]|nr:ABC transporter permease [Candidatus Calditenuaceae archaeon]MDW8073639.1 ABC transporter permease [Nitrososphaerota archaeon]